jgi:site-specific DNA-methyltransferase (adenine-specific)
MEQLQLYQGDCLELLKTVPDNSIDLTVTSPPYDNLRTYNDNIDQWGYEKFQKIAKELYRITKEGGIIVWIVNDATIDGSETGTSFRHALYFKECGFCLHDTMIWQKPSPYQHKNRYIQDFEYMFVFSKGARKYCNLICDRKNKWGGTQIHGTERQRNGKTKDLSETQKSKCVKEYGARFNIWDIPPDKNNRTGHPAVFPLQLAQDHIISWSNEGDTVLDCFMGSGTTGIACINTNRDFIGMELDEQYFKIAKDRINKAQSEWLDAVLGGAI